jgi:hypothetical protein
MLKLNLYKGHGASKICMGDSGGPVLQEKDGIFTQIAVNSKGDCNNQGTSTMFSMISNSDEMRPFAISANWLRRFLEKDVFSSSM